MMGIPEYLAEVVVAIREDAALKHCFQRILQMGGATQQVRVSTLLTELEKLQAPPEVLRFVRLLTDEKLAHQALEAISR